MSNYQNISDYRGSLYGEIRHEGIEYDWQVPDDLVMASPGGVAATEHHWTKGFNGRGNTSGDWYAGQGERYVAGVYGNLYETGQEAGQHMGYYGAAPDYQFWMNQEPQQYSYSQSRSDQWAPMQAWNDRKNEQSLVPYTREHYGGEVTGDNSFEMIERPGEGGNEDDADGVQYDERVVVSRRAAKSLPPLEDLPSIAVKTTTVSPWLLLLFFLMAFIAFEFWAETGHAFIKERFHEGRPLTWKHLALYSLIITVIFVIVIWLAGVPITTFESL